MVSGGEASAGIAARGRSVAVGVLGQRRFQNKCYANSRLRFI